MTYASLNALPIRSYRANRDALCQWELDAFTAAPLHRELLKTTLTWGNRAYFGADWDANLA